jgi:restriction system protein
VAKKKIQSQPDLPPAVWGAIAFAFLLPLIKIWLIIAIIAPIIAMIVAYIMVFRAKQERFNASGISEIDRMSGVEFEDRMAIYFTRRGYEVLKTPKTGDYGVDLIITKGGVRTVVQVKRYSSPVDQKPVREAHAGMSHYKAMRAMAIANQPFTKHARDLARSTGVTIWDRATLVEKLLEEKELP